MFRKRTPVSSSPSPAASRQPLQRPPRPIQSNCVDSNGTGGRVHVPCPALIQRLIIIHDGLMPQQRRNPQLNEDASLAEHGEFILYYYDHSLHEHGRVKPESPMRRMSSMSIGSDAGVNKPPADHATEEAVKFAGICRALRSLPLALKPEKFDIQNEEVTDGTHEEKLAETDVVHLQDSTLVFVPLELGGSIFAIAQIPRADKTQKMSFSKSGHPQSQPASRGFGADPTAMQGAIRHIHATFSLLFGGGIHGRLLQTKKAERSKNWVLEVVDDEEDVDESSDSDDFRLTTKGDLAWNVQKDTQVDVAKESPNGSRRKSRSLKQLSSSITSSFNCAMPESDETENHQPEENSFGDYRYGGMEELFSLRKEHRKLTNALKEDSVPMEVDSMPMARSRNDRFGGMASTKNHKWTSSRNAEDLFNDIANDYEHPECERRIENLLNVLPITHLREDLVKFYDEWLSRMQGVCEIMQGGVGRCVVDMVPSPLIVSPAIAPVRGQHPPLSPTAFVCLAAGEFMKSLMDEDVEKLEGLQGRLSGMSLFYQNRLVLSEFFPSHRNKYGHADMQLPPEIPYMIAEYFLCSEKRQIKTKATAGHDSVQNGEDSPRPLQRWMSGLSMQSMSMAAIKDEAVIDNGNSLSSSPEGNVKNATNGASLGFMVYPPSLTDSARTGESLFVRHLKRDVWLPRVHLPFTRRFDVTGFDDETETYAALFECQDFSFIPFFELPSSEEEESALEKMVEELKPKTRKMGRRGSGSSRPKLISDQTRAFTDMLTLLADQLTEFGETYSSQDEDSASEGRAPIKEINSNSEFPGEQGMDIICIDRDESSFVLLSHHDLSSKEFKRIAPKNDGDTSSSNGSKPKFGLFGMGPKGKEASDEKVRSRSREYSTMLDCRHKLAAYLPLDVMLAFDDMFNEMGRLSCRRNVLTVGEAGAQGDNDMGTNKSIELCSFLPQGWVYARAYGSVELYILLDTSRYVTINDVQKAVTRVRERIFNDRIR